jgi:hypothetical protein
MLPSYLRRSIGRQDAGTEGRGAGVVGTGKAFGAIESGRLRSADSVRVTRSLHKDGRKLYLVMSFNLARDAAGAVIGSFAIARDVSDRHAANAAR